VIQQISYYEVNRSLKNATYSLTSGISS